MKNKLVKKTSMFALLLGIAGVSNAQWTGTAPSAYLLSGYSSVGIGTTAPQTLLEINQTTNTTPGTPSTYGFSLYNNSTPGITMGTDASYAYLQSWYSKPLQINSQGNNILLNPSSGNVGIGTTSPNTKLEVHGSISLYNSNSNYSLFFGQDQMNVNQYGEWGIQYVTNGGGGTGGLNFWKPAGTDHSGYNNFGNNFFFLRDNGNVGIGTGTPAERLDVNGVDANGCVAILRGNVTIATTTTTPNSFSAGTAASSALNYGTAFSGYNASRSTSGTWTCNTDGAHNGGNAVFGDVIGNLHFATIPSSSSGSSAQTLSDAQVLNNTVMAINSNGKVVIGKPFALSGAVNTINVNTPGAYNLYVAGGILTEQVRVALVNSSNWADYVFADNYNLQPIKEVGQYVKTYKHLPGVPSADEVASSGIDVATMDATLLKKIEELTLYIVELQKRDDDKTAKMQDLQDQIKVLSDKK